jgi:hypothetical protein
LLLSDASDSNTNPSWVGGRQNTDKSLVALRATARQVIRGVALVGAANVQAHSDRRAEKTAEAAKYDAFGPNNHGGAFRPFDCGRTA